VFGCTAKDIREEGDGSPSKIVVSLGSAARQWSSSLTTQPIFGGVLDLETTVHKPLIL